MMGLIDELSIYFPGVIGGKRKLKLEEIICGLHKECQQFTIMIFVQTTSCTVTKVNYSVLYKFYICFILLNL